MLKINFYKLPAYCTDIWDIYIVFIYVLPLLYFIIVLIINAMSNKITNHYSTSSWNDIE